MRFVERSVYVGPSLYASFPVIRFRVDLGPLEEWPSVRLGKDFTDRLVETLPGLKEHGCSYGVPGGFIRRLEEDEGTWLGHILEHVAIELQNEAGEDVTFGKTRGTGTHGEYDVVFEYHDDKVGLAAGRLARTLLLSLLPEAALEGVDGVPEEFDWESERDSFIRFVQRNAFGPSTAALVKAAVERDVPWLRLNDYSMVQFGHGCWQERIQATVTSKTPHIAVEIASDKEETNRILADLGLPVPEQHLVYGTEDAVRAAERVGYPVVVKPFNANHGRGVSLDLQDAEHVELAFRKAQEHSRGVLVEKFATGFDHRILVVDGEVIAVSKRVPGHVVGDGASTIERLVEKVNEDPRRGIGHEKVLTRIELDYQATRLLELKDYTSETVPAEGEVVYLRSTGNLSTGGTSVDLTDVIHPDNAGMARRSAKAIGLDVAGVDFITEDITKSYKDAGGIICEVNAAPGFRMHTNPSEGTPRDVAGPVLDMLFPPGKPARIPILAVTGTNGKTTTSRMLAHIYKLSGKRVGLATTEGVYIDGQLSVAGDMTGPKAARMILRDPSVEVAVLETARGGLLRSGMGYRRSDVSACLNVREDHLGLKGIDTLEQLAEVKRIVIEAAKDTAVLNADDPLCLKMSGHVSAEHILYVTTNPTHDLVREHVRAGGRAIGLEDGINGHMITLYDKGAHMPLLWTHLIPATLEGRALHNVQNAMFAAAMAYCGGVKLEDIRHGLKTFDTTFFQAPGRMNVFDGHPFRVILDYAHNAHAVEAMCSVVDQLPVPGRRIVVLAAPGDRRDEDIEQLAKTAAGHFDHYICRRDDTLRGRGDSEVPEMLRDALLGEGVPEDDIQMIPSEAEAVSAALRMGQSDDLILMFGDALTRTWNQITQFRPDSDESVVELPLDEVVAIELPDLPSDEVKLGAKIMRDERGVFLAPELED
ncbi:MAG: cyanophycin synthetase [Gemmatimonadetes bacterium]|nr:cyanophycin synthetase [Gemmatimonadota bacterium]